MSDLVTLTSVVSKQEQLYCCGRQVLSREEAKSRLRKLVPDTEEYRQLQQILINAIGIKEISLPDATYKVYNSSPDSVLLGGFGPSEHMEIGKALQLQGLTKGEPLLVKGVCRIHFSHIVALAGDFYGVVGKAISLGGPLEERAQRFKDAFNTLAQADDDELRRIVAEIEDEYTAVRDDNFPHHCYSSSLMARGNAVEKIKKDVGDLLADNSDHFSAHAKIAYEVGHACAREEAAQAGRTQDVARLKIAYAMDAFACHFLSDLFSAGHIRNQRGELEIFLRDKLEFSSDIAKIFAGILTAAQHEKDGKDGLTVTAKDNSPWRAYGDGYFFLPKNAENARRVILAAQQSVNEVYQAYCVPHNIEPSTVGDLIPSVAFLNPLPLYEIKEDFLLLYQNRKKVEIKSKMDYVVEAIGGQALSYLPEGYVNSMLNAKLKSFLHLPDVEMPDWIKAVKNLASKVIAPRVERITSIAWHIVGVASYHQVQQGNEQLNEKVDEMAGVLNATYENTVKILEEIQKLRVQLKQSESKFIFQQIREHVDIIRDVQHEVTLYAKTLSDEQLKNTQQKLWDAYLRLSRVFQNKAKEEALATYKAMLLEDTTSKSPNEICLKVTLCFRQLLDLQTQAFRLYLTLRAQREGSKAEGDIFQQRLKFDEDIENQIKINKQHVDERLIYESQIYIQLQLTKDKVERKILPRLIYKEDEDG